MIHAYEHNRYWLIQTLLKSQLALE